jgi:tetratricopeptide (TPR) repeat protein
VNIFVAEHSTQVIAVGVIIVAIGGGIGLWAYSQAQADQQSQTLFYAALKSYDSLLAAAPEKKDAPKAPEESYKKALEQFSNVIKQYPDYSGGIAALFYAGSCSYNLKKDDEALTYYQDFLKKVGLREDILKPFAYEGMGYVYERKGDYKKAIEWYEKQKADHEASLAIMAPLNLARCYAALGDKDNACKAYQEFSSKHPSSASVDIAKIGETEFCQKPVR